MKLLTTIVFNCDLVPYFIEHYKKIGITEILCVLNVHENKEIADKVEKYIKNTIFKVVKTIDEPFSSIIHANNMEEIKKSLIGQDEWFAVADLDEFHEYAHPIQNMINGAEKENANCVIGYFLDRISSDGTFPVLDHLRSLDEQFPLGCQITKNKLNGIDRKVMLFKGYHLQIVRGFHFAYPKEKVFSITNNIVHHFKWHSTINDNIKYKNRSSCNKYLKSAFNHLLRNGSFFYDNKFDGMSLEMYKKTIEYIKKNIDLNDLELNIRTVYKKEKNGYRNY